MNLYIYVFIYIYICVCDFIHICSLSLYIYIYVRCIPLYSFLSLTLALAQGTRPRRATWYPRTDAHRSHVPLCLLCGCWPVFCLTNKPDPDVASALVVLPDWAMVNPVLTIDAVGPQPCKKRIRIEYLRKFFTRGKYEIF